MLYLSFDWVELNMSRTRLLTHDVDLQFILEVRACNCMCLACFICTCLCSNLRFCLCIFEESPQAREVGFGKRSSHDDLILVCLLRVRPVFMQNEGKDGLDGLSLVTTTFGQVSALAGLIADPCLSLPFAFSHLQLDQLDGPKYTPCK